MNAHCALDYQNHAPAAGHPAIAPGAEQQWLLRYQIGRASCRERV